MFWRSNNSPPGISTSPKVLVGVFFVQRANDTSDRYSALGLTLMAIKVRRAWSVVYNYSNVKLRAMSVVAPVGV